jgi:predicted DNA-binding transcriptional regulator AlpA
MTRWLDAEATAALLGMKVRQFRERTAKLPGFPTPIRPGGKGHPRWRDDEVQRWAEQQRQVA